MADEYRWQPNQDRHDRQAGDCHSGVTPVCTVGRWQECQMAVQYLHGPIGFHAGVFLVFISTQFSLSALFVGMWDYIVNLPMMILTVWSADGAGAEMFGNALAYWQGGWTIFYWV